MEPSNRGVEEGFGAKENGKLRSSQNLVMNEVGGNQKAGSSHCAQDAGHQHAIPTKLQDIIRGVKIILSLVALCACVQVYFFPGVGHMSWTWSGLSNGLADRWEDYTNVLTQPEDLSNDSRVLHEIPQYVLDYAPLVHLYSEEQFWPCDIAEHLFHVTPELNYTPIQGRLQSSNLTNLDQLNEFEKGRHVYLTSDDNVEERPDWLGGQKNIPDDFSEDMEERLSKPMYSRPSNHFRKQTQGGRSDAPAILITVNKGHGVVDAFWFYFYSYNLGNKVFNIRWGNHIGDWEHSMIRFQHGKPKAVYFSEHNFGSAYTYAAVEKIGKRVSTSTSRLCALLTAFSPSYTRQ